MTYRGQPDRDLQCYFQTNQSHDYMYPAHTGIAAITSASPTSLKLTGTFHDQFDWSVLEWNRDNQYEHLALRNVPNGDFTGLTLSYHELRTSQCVPPDSPLYDWQDWSRLRIFTGNRTEPYKIPYQNIMTAGPGGGYASATFELLGEYTPGKYYAIDFAGEVYSTRASTDGQLIFHLDYIAAAGQSFKVTLSGPNYPHTYEVTSVGVEAVNNELAFTFPVSTAAGQYVKVAFTGPSFPHVYEYTSAAAGEHFSQKLKALMDADGQCPVGVLEDNNTLTLIAKGFTGGSYQASCWILDAFVESSPGEAWWSWTDAEPNYEPIAAKLKEMMDNDPNCPVWVEADDWLGDWHNGDDRKIGYLQLTGKGATGGEYTASCWVVDHFLELESGGPWWPWTDVRVADVLEGLQSENARISELSVTGSTVTVTAKLQGIALNGKMARAYPSDSWDIAEQEIAGGAIPEYYPVSLSFDGLLDETGAEVPVTNIRAIRWTYCAALGSGVFAPLDYTVTWTNYSVAGAGAFHQYAGQYSQTTHCEDRGVEWDGYFLKQRGNFVGGAIAYFDAPATKVTLSYNCPKDHDLYIGSRYLDINGIMRVTVDDDDASAKDFDLYMAAGDIGWDRVCRLKVGSFPAGKHKVVVTTAGTKNIASQGYRVFFNFAQAVVPTDEPYLTVHDHDDITLASDWDTAHSLELPPQRVIWNLATCGFKGRTNHYLGALKWYKLAAVDGKMAAGKFNIWVNGATDFADARTAGEGVAVHIDGVPFTRAINEGEETLLPLALDLAQRITDTCTGVWAQALGNEYEVEIRVFSRRRSGGAIEPNGLPIEVFPGSLLQMSGSDLSGGEPYHWVVDTSSPNPVNAPTLAWTKAYLEELHSRGMSAVLALSQELGHEPKTSTLAARYSDGKAVWLNTPALQTNFGPDTQAFFKSAYLQLAQLMSTVGIEPFLQFGECQWWYFATRWDMQEPLTPAGDYWQVAPSLGVYDNYTASQFAIRYGGFMHVFVDDCDRPINDPVVYGTALGREDAKTPAEVLAAYPHECELLSTLIGEYTSAISAYVKGTVATCKFEVLYPLDVNEGSVCQNINQPPALHWGAAKLDAFKTEGFGYMFAKNLAQLQTLIKYPFVTRNFSRANSRCLLGSYDNTDPFERALMEAKSEGTGDKVLWAFDQFSMRSFRLPLYQGERSVTIVSWN